MVQNYIHCLKLKFITTQYLLITFYKIIGIAYPHHCRHTLRSNNYLDFSFSYDTIPQLSAVVIVVPCTLQILSEAISVGRIF